MTSDRYERLDAASWLAALAVVMLHSAAQTVSDPAIYASGGWLAANLYDSAVRWCVPVFVMISGALLLDPQRPLSPRVFYRRRLARIQIPLVFWTVFYLLWSTTLAGFDQGRLDVSFWPRKVAEGRPYYHLWYLYMIVGLYLFAPAVRLLYARSTPAARKLWVIGILGVAILDSLYRQALGADPGFFLTWFLPYLGYFVAGRMIFEGQWRMPRPGLVLLTGIALTAAGVLWLSSAQSLNLYFYDYFSLTVPLMSLAAFQWFVDTPALPRLPALAPLTFGVYLVHPALLDLTQRAGLVPHDAAAIWRLPLVTILVFGLSAAVVWALRQHRLTRPLV
ncbi:acyltransferase [Bordetella holmesii]|uniref:Acyltransferase n=2 Tax=Bordetella holmesii TaxID=35814 RepID=A0A158M2D5_9BORD|nr:acyltransferase family protein [Bordetella holmesii]AHV92316.1 acyltransferase family protein [Bordetella holmesii ATCC 51541]AIT27230.1 acyltransferase family protein [Bordetella holmesii 44057]EWM44395.1 acyltransferase family protein [Bordetella holmesii 41130]EWM47812.1 acyltransferase family protein [Bordetella holmesii 35009]EWM51979.1 acyltransferase family protein [Bordetella holmesii 70147]